MASPYTLRPSDVPDDAAFHVLSRGVDRMAIFRSPIDHADFLACFRRYLSPEREVDRYRRAYRKLHDQAAVLAYGLMLNHFHMAVAQKRAGGLQTLLQPALTGYARQFNHRHGRVGPVFQSRYRSRRAATPYQLRFLIAYTHLNDPVRQLDHPWISHNAYLGDDRHHDWLDVERGLALFGGVDGYVSFMDRHGPAIVARKLAKIGIADQSHAYRPIGRAGATQPTGIRRRAAAA